MVTVHAAWTVTNHEKRYEEKEEELSMSRGEQKVQRPFSWFRLGGKAHRFQLDIFKKEG